MCQLRNVHLYHLHISRRDPVPELPGSRCWFAGKTNRVSGYFFVPPSSPTEFIMSRSRLYFVALVLTLPLVAGAQQKQRLLSLNEALQAGAILSGRQGPRGVNWIDDGKRFSYTDRDPATNAPVIRAYDPPTGNTTTLFTSAGLTLPGTSEPFTYDSFEWAKDSKHLVFQTNFQPIYRRSGISDFYVYSIADKSLTFATTTRRGVSISFVEPVAGLVPSGVVRHPSLTVTVDDPEALVAALVRASQRGSTGEL